MPDGRSLCDGEVGILGIDPNRNFRIQESLCSVQQPHYDFRFQPQHDYRLHS